MNELSRAEKLILKQPIEHRVELRQRYCKPFFDLIDECCKEFSDDFTVIKSGTHLQVVNQNDRCGKALLYYLNNSDKFKQFIDSPNTVMSTNEVEQCLRYIVNIRKNSYCFGTFERLLDNCINLSVCVTCRKNNVPIDDFMNKLLHAVSYHMHLNAINSINFNDKRNCRQQISFNGRKLPSVSELMDGFDYSPFLRMIFGEKVIPQGLHFVYCANPDQPIVQNSGGEVKVFLRNSYEHMLDPRNIKHMYGARKTLIEALKAFIEFDLVANKDRAKAMLMLAEQLLNSSDNRAVSFTSLLDPTKQSELVNEENLTLLLSLLNKNELLNDIQGIAFKNKQKF